MPFSLLIGKNTTTHYEEQKNAIFHIFGLSKLLTRRENCSQKGITRQKLCSQIPKDPCTHTRTGCPLLLWTLCFLPFLSFQSTNDKNFGHFCKAHQILISKISLILKMDQYLTTILPSYCWVPDFKINICNALMCCSIFL